MAYSAAGRPIALLIFASLLSAAMCAPVNEAEPATNVSSPSPSSDFDSAIAEIRAKRELLKKKSIASRLDRYVPNAAGNDDNGDDEADEDDSNEDDEPIAALLDNPSELNLLAKEIALDILMEESASEGSRFAEHPSSSSLMKKKKKKSTGLARIDDERRKRINSLFYRLMDERNANTGDVDSGDVTGFRANEDDDDNDSILNGENSFEPDDEDSVLEQTISRALANQGLSPHEIEALLSQLEGDDEEDDENDSRKKKRSGEWRKFPRAALRWRFLRSQDPEAGLSTRHQAYDEQEDDDSPASDAEENRFVGRGFHRMGPGVLDDISRGIPGATDKRMLRPLKSRRILAGMIKKRSVPESASPIGQSGESSEFEIPVKAEEVNRKKRSLSSNMETIATSSAQNDTTAPLALPLTVKRSEGQQKAFAKEESENHSPVIRKKSVDLDDYFGFDKRKRAKSSDEEMRNYLENEYYKTIAGSVAYRRKRGPGTDAHAAHGMMKKNNSTGPSVDRTSDEERRLIHLRAQMLADLIDDLDPEELNEMADQLTQNLAEALQDDDDDDDSDENSEEYNETGVTLKRRSAGLIRPHHRRFLTIKKKKALSSAESEEEDEERRKRYGFAKDFDDDDKRRKRFQLDEDRRRKRTSFRTDDDDQKRRRKRFPIKRSPSGRRGNSQSEFDGDDECVIAEQVVATCNMVSHLYGGYRPVLSDACFRHQACAICSDNENACDVEFKHRVLTLCGPDLLCQSQSRHLLTALNQLDLMEANFFQGSRNQIQSLCRRDSCLPDLYKRR